jgi:hypothetical protein
VFPLSTDPIPDGKDGWLVFFDEMPAAPKAVQVAAYKILLDRMIGEHDIHPAVKMVCAGNLATDKAVSNRLSTALQSRLVHLQLKATLKNWMDWADDNDVDFRVKAYLSFRPDMLHNFNPNHADETYPCPRTWAFMSDLIKPWASIGYDKMPVLAGTIGQGPARELKSFTDIFDSLPTRAEILSSPDTMQVPTRPDVTYALTGLLGNMAEDNNMKKLIKLIDRLPMEFQVICMQTISKTSPELGQHQIVRDWMVRNMDKLV